MKLKTRLLSLFHYNSYARRVRDVRQGELAECGLAALASLMSAYGVDVPLDRLRAMAGSTLYGTSLRTLREIARRKGFEATARRVEEIAGLNALAPCLVHLNFIHFAVVERVTATEVVLSDPLAGPSRMPLDRFSRAFTGIALTLKPTPLLQLAKVEDSASRRNLLTDRRMVPGYAAAAASGTALVAAAVAAGRGINGFLPMVAALVLAAVLREVAIRRSAVAIGAIAEAAQSASIGHVTEAPTAEFVLRSPQRANALLSAPAALCDPPLADAVLAAATIIPLMLGAVLSARLLGLTGIVSIGLEAAILALLVAKRGAAVPDFRLRQMPVRTPSGDALLRAESWGLGNAGVALFRMLAGSHAAAAAAAMPGAERGAVVAAVRAGFAGVRLLMLLLVGKLLLEGGAAVGPLFASGILVVMAGAQLGCIASGLRTPDVTGALHRLADRFETVAGEPPAHPPAGMALVMEDVAWRPAAMLPDAVAGIGLAIPVGGSLALVGPPRSGATTVARLAAGWLSPIRGTVSAEPAILLGAQWLFGAGRVRDLLSLGMAIDEAAMREIIDAVGLADAIAAREGLDLFLSDDAEELSGGQRRRLMLAIALLRRPALLVLDGTLDALGTQSAAELLDMCRARGTAVLLAGHRETVSALCDARYQLAVPA